MNEKKTKKSNTWHILWLEEYKIEYKKKKKNSIEDIYFLYTKKFYYKKFSNWNKN